MLTIFAADPGPPSSSSLDEVTALLAGAQVE